MGSFTGKLDAFTLAFAEYLNRSERDRLIAVLVTQGAGEAIIKLALATPDLERFFIYTFNFDFSETTHSQLRQLCSVLIETIDKELVKNAVKVDIDSQEGISNIFEMYEAQLKLLGKVEAKKNHWEAVQYRLLIIADGKGLTKVADDDKPAIIKKAKELLAYFK